WEFGGREIKHTGDGIMAAFPTTSNSVEAAIAIQAKVRARNRFIPEPPLHLKIGINAGEPIVEDDDLFGATVQLAARVVDAARSEQILVSEIVRGICAGKNLRFANRGPFQLDGFKDHIVLHEVIWDEKAPLEDAPATEPPRPENTRAEDGTGEPDAGETAEQPVAAEPARAPGRRASPPAAGHAPTAQADKEAGP
ncbi:MAG: adenylate/guanylate cyclase domain-containing protein, partial [Proteobacteria bacterium]|nr:adenylate/guanylate cyclase domain-containing protein [Pseudomonadota bacterium]